MIICILNFRYYYLTDMIRTRNDPREDQLLHKLRNCMKKPYLQSNNLMNSKNIGDYKQIAPTFQETPSKQGKVRDIPYKSMSKKETSMYDYHSKYQQGKTDKTLDYIEFKAGRFQSVILPNKNEQRKYSFHQQSRPNLCQKQNILNQKFQSTKIHDYNQEQKNLNRICLNDNTNILDIKPNNVNFSNGTNGYVCLNQTGKTRNGRRQFLSEAQQKLTEFQRKLQMVNNQTAKIYEDPIKSNSKPNQLLTSNYSELKKKYQQKSNYDKDKSEDAQITPRNVNNQIKVNPYINGDSYPIRSVKHSLIDSTENVTKNYKINTSQYVQNLKRSMELRKNQQNYQTHKENKSMIEQFQNHRITKSPLESHNKVYSIKKNQNPIITLQNNSLVGRRLSFDESANGNQKTLDKLKKINEFNEKINERIRNIIDSFQNKHKQ